MNTIHPSVENPNSPASSRPPMSRAERRIVLGMLAGLMLFQAAMTDFSGPGFNWRPLLLGGWLAQGPLLAIWIALGRQPLTVRLPWALSLAGVLGLIAAWTSTRYNSVPPSTDVAMLCSVLTLCLSMTLPLGILRWRWRWQIAHREDPPVAAAGNQFGLRSLLLWTAGMAVFCGLAVHILGDSLSTIRESRVSELFSVVLIVVVYTVFLFPLVIPSVGFVLADRSRIKFGVWTAAMSVLVSAVIIAVIFFSASSAMRDPWAVLKQVCPQFAVLEFGFLGVLVGVLFLVRLCGYRLLRGKQEAAAEEASTEVADTPVLQPAGRRSTFGWVIASLLVLFVVLVWPAVRLQQNRQSQVEAAKIYHQWTRVGVVPSCDADGRRIIGAYFRPDQPPTEAALRMLSDPQNAASIRSLHLSRSRLTDAQMPYLAKLENLQLLALDNTRITDAGLVHLYGMKNLRSINLSGTRVTRQGVERLQQDLPNCHILANTPVSAGQ